MSTSIETQGIPSRYNKRIEDLIEDAEIEAELEAERDIRIKNAKWMLISSVGLIFLGTVYFWTDSQSNVKALDTIPPISEIAQITQKPKLKPIPFPLENSRKSINSETKDLLVKTEVLEKEQPKNSTKPLGTEPLKLTTESFKTSTLENSDPKLGITLNEISTPTPLVNLLKKVASKKKHNQKSKLPRATIQEANFSIQLGAFSIKENANKLVKKIQKKGINPIIDIKQINKTTYSVITGEFNNKKLGQTTLEKLKEYGFKPKLRKTSSGKFSLIAGEFPSQNKAKKLHNKLTQKGFLSSIRPLKHRTTTYAVKFGAFSNLKQAKTSQAKLDQLGISKTFIKKI